MKLRHSYIPLCVAVSLTAALLLPGSMTAQEISHGLVPEAVAPETGDESLDALLDTVAPSLKKWATVCVIQQDAGGVPVFKWLDYKDTGFRTDFWPASTIKLYAVVAAMELLHEKGLPLDVIVQFEHQDEHGRWFLDCARSMREMISEVFRRSSNEDYTLLLRMVGIDRINSEFLIPERGFPHSALMRGYVLERPYRFVAKEPQRITVRTADGTKTAQWEHTWSGRFYAEERGCTIIDAKTGNVTSPRELAECLRRILFHEYLPEEQRYRLTTEQLNFLRHGADGLTGLETTDPESGPTAWKNAAERIFPKARFFHKCGVIKDYALEVAALDDTGNSSTRFILVPVVNAGEASKPNGKKIVSEMAEAISKWVRDSNSRELQ